jgi:phospholipase/carboxylesterase
VSRPQWTRRDVLGRLGRLAAGVVAAPLVGSCAGRPAERLAVAPAGQSADRLLPGTHALGLDGERDGVLYLPAGGSPRGLLLMLHGAGGTGRRSLRLVMAAADAASCAVLAPDSRGPTWDAVPGRFGPDVRFIERALAGVLPEAAGARPLAVAGFSDGATYALALGRANGQLFSHILAFSPGFLIPTHPAGTPGIFVSHGRSDQVLPIETCSRVLVPKLRREGYQVRYREFDGRHEVPPEVAREAMDWWAASLPQPESTPRQ